MMLKPRMLFILICCFTSVKQAPIKMHSPKPDTRQPAKSTASKEQPVITMKRSTSEQAPLTIAYIDNLHGKQLEVNYYSTHTQYFKAAINPFLRISFDNNALKTFSKDTKLKSGLVYKEVDKSNIHYSYEFPSTLIKWRNSTGTDKSTAKVFVTIYNQNNQTLTRIPSVRMLSRIDEVKNTVKIENKKSNGLRDACFNMAVIINN
ncbi:uncharacterized protein LOC142333513 isoform X2 [Lycorma delicatula]|uniref:uncharacterized protein LOC142333513 isoform X2 n=1 Tax=Lycorma delicatula TaxID=130591 RepID=UPI003F51881E